MILLEIRIQVQIYVWKVVVSLVAFWDRHDPRPL